MFRWGLKNAEEIVSVAAVELPFPRGLRPGAAVVDELVDLFHTQGQGGGDDVMAAKDEFAAVDVVHALDHEPPLGLKHPKGFFDASSYQFI